MLRATWLCLLATLGLPARGEEGQPDWIRRNFATPPPAELLTSRARTLEWIDVLGDRRFAQVGHVVAMAADPDGEWLATADGSRIGIWDLRSGLKTRVLDAPKYVDAICVSRDGKRLAAGGRMSAAITIWDTTRWEVERSFTSELGARSLAFTLDGSRLLRSAYLTGAIPSTRSP